MTAALQVQAQDEESPDDEGGVPPRKKLRTREAARYCGRSDAAMAQLRVRGVGPRYTKVGHLIYYDISELDAWLEGR